MTLPRAAALALVALLPLLAGCDRPEPPFAKVDGKWRYRDTLIADADPASFVAIDDHYAKDRLRAYYADTYRDGKEYFTVRHARVVEVKGAHPATFQVLRLGYARDARNVYYEGVRMAVRDPATFELVGDGFFGRDAQSAYYYDAEIAGSQGAPSFAALDSHYARDARRVYYADLIGVNGRAVPQVTALAGADPGSFRALDSGYAADRSQAWFRGQALAGADAATFRTLFPGPDQPDAEDARATYRLGARTPR